MRKGPPPVYFAPTQLRQGLPRGAILEGSGTECGSLQRGLPGVWVQAVDSVHAIPRLIFKHPHKTPGESLLPYPMLQMGTLRLSGEGHVRCEQSCPLGT